MTDNPYFPEISNWEQRDPNHDDDHAEIRFRWRNPHTREELRVKYVEGPFGMASTKFILETRKSTNDWKKIQEHPNKLEILKNAMEWAERHNETSSNE